MDKYRLTLVLEAEEEDEDKAAGNIQQQLMDCAQEHPANIGTWEKVEE